MRVRRRHQSADAGVKLCRRIAGGNGEVEAIDEPRLDKPGSPNERRLGLTAPSGRFDYRQLFQRPCHVADERARRACIPRNFKQP
jgi:hypothetical protein